MPDSGLIDDDDDEEKVIAVHITKAQFSVLKRMTNQRSAHLFTLVDLVGEMSHDGLEFFRRIGSPDGKDVAEFLSQAKPNTLKFLTEMRDEEIEMLKNSIRLVIALGWVGWCLKWIVATAFGAFVGGIFIYKELASWFKSTH